MHSERKRTRCLTLPLGQWKDGKPPNSIFVVLGSARQKGVVFRSIAGNMKAKTTIVKMLRGVAVRDCLPKELIPGAQRLHGAEGAHDEKEWAGGGQRARDHPQYWRSATQISMAAWMRGGGPSGGSDEQAASVE